MASNVPYNDWLAIAAATGLGLDGALNLYSFYVETNTRLANLEAGGAESGFADITDPTFAGGALATDSTTPGSDVMDQNRAAIQAAIDYLDSVGGGTLYFPKGRYPVNRAPAQLHCVLMENTSRIRIYGHGATLAMAGDTGGTGATMFGLQIKDSSDILIDGLTFSQRDLTTPGEQQHMLQIGGPGNTLVEYVWVRNCYFIEQPTAGSGGDGARLLGGATLTIKNVFFDHCLFKDCHRSGIGVQAGVGDVHISNSYFVNINDQAIDFEPTDTGPLGPFYIDKCGFLGHTGTYVTLTGRDSVNHNYSRMTNCVIIDGGINALNLQYAKLTNNFVWRTDNSSDSAIGLSRACYDVDVSHNTVIRTGTTRAGGITIKQAASVSPYNIRCCYNDVTVSSPNGTGIDLSGSYDYQAAGNTITYTNAATDTVNGFFGIFCLGQVSKPSGTITNNIIKSTGGRMTAGVHVARDTFATVGKFIIEDNMSSNCQTDVSFSATIAECVDGLPIIRGHSGATGLGAADISGIPAWCIGHYGGALGAGQYMGTVSPESNVTAAQGSSYVWRNGDSSSLWFKQTTVTSTGWVQTTVP